MKKLFLACSVASMLLASCGGGGSGESPEDFAKKMCDARTKVYQAKSEEEMAPAKEELEKLQKELDENTDVDFVRKVGELDMNCNPE